MTLANTPERFDEPADWCTMNRSVDGRKANRAHRNGDKVLGTKGRCFPRLFIFVTAHTARVELPGHMLTSTAPFTPDSSESASSMQQASMIDYSERPMLHLHIS